MKYTVKTMFLPVCLVLMVGTQLLDYFLSGDFNPIFIAMFCFLTPAAIKGLKPDYNTDSIQMKILLIIGIIILLFSIYTDFIK